METCRRGCGALLKLKRILLLRIPYASRLARCQPAYSTMHAAMPFATSAKETKVCSLPLLACWVSKPAEAPSATAWAQHSARLGLQGSDNTLPNAARRRGSSGRLELNTNCYPQARSSSRRAVSNRRRLGAQKAFFSSQSGGQREVEAARKIAPLPRHLVPHKVPPQSQTMQMHWAGGG